VAPALALLLAVSAGGLDDLRLELGSQAEARSRTLSLEGEAAETRLSLEARPRVAVVAEGPALRVSAAYAPWVRAWELDERPELGHELHLGVAAATHRWRIDAGATGRRGRMDPLDDLGRSLSSESATPLPTLEPQPFAAAEARAAASVLLGGRTSLRTAAAFGVTGGTDAAARLLLPVSRSVSASAAVERRVTWNDTVTLGAGAVASRTDPGSELAVLAADATWRRQLSRTLEAWAGAGAALQRADPVETRAGRPTLAPTGVLGLAHASARGRSASLTGRAFTTLDPYAGVAYRAVEARATLGVRPWRDIGLQASLVGLTSLPDPDVALGGLDLVAGWASGPDLTLEAGASGRWQRDETAGRPSFVEVHTFVGVRFAAGARRSAGRMPAGAAP